MLDITAVLVLLVGLVVLAPFFLKWLGEENILVTTVKEGTAKAIMRGKSFERFIMAFAGYHLNDPTKSWYKPNFPDWEVLYHGKGNRHGFTYTQDDFYDDRSFILKHLGLYRVGWPWANNVYVYAFEWNETYTDSEGKEKVLPRAEATDFIFVTDFTYAIVTQEAETRDLLPTDERTLVTVAVRNPYRALFSGEDWMRRITAVINRHVRNFVGSKTYEELISHDDANAATASDWTDFSAPIIALNTKLPDDDVANPPNGLQGRYGVEIRTADLQNLDLSGDGKKSHQEAATTAYVARQQAAAKRTIGQADADVIEMKGAGEASALSKRLKVLETHGENGKLLAQLDAMRDAGGAGARVIWANNPFIGTAAEVLKAGTKGDKTS